MAPPRPARPIGAAGGDDPHDPPAERVPEIGWGDWKLLRNRDETVADDRGVHHLELEPYGYRWYRVGGLTSARPG
jgi:hypothetical protein